MEDPLPAGKRGPRIHAPHAVGDELRSAAHLPGHGHVMFTADSEAVPDKRFDGLLRSIRFLVE
ncbi:hypothetical protein [Amycolatopsis orientalis]|uniref:hypothetical protein n=1 Tax=Amycolatopsis orientalis TaxID=31958 RepID=UPI000ADB40DB|nr:hypothetical protein [Amycolatopsis orientalis]